MSGVVAWRLTIRCGPPQVGHNHWIAAAAGPVDGSGYAESKVGRKRIASFLAELEIVLGLIKRRVIGQVIHSGSVFSTVFPKLSTTMGKGLVPAVGMRESPLT
jgi:hypothetical protein